MAEEGEDESEKGKKGKDVPRPPSISKWRERTGVKETQKAHAENKAAESTERRGEKLEIIRLLRRRRAIHALLRGSLLLLLLSQTSDPRENMSFAIIALFFSRDNI